MGTNTDPFRLRFDMLLEIAKLEDAYIASSHKYSIESWCDISCFATSRWISHPRLDGFVLLLLPIYSVAECIGRWKHRYITPIIYRGIYTDHHWSQFKMKGNPVSMNWLANLRIPIKSSEYELVRKPMNPHNKWYFIHRSAKMGRLSSSQKGWMNE